MVIIDYGMGNLGSVRRAFEECGASALVSENPAELKTADKIVLPGVGSFKEGMAHIRERGWANAIKNAVKDGVPLLGICLGMQLLAEKGFEGDETEGLGLIRGDVKRLEPSSEKTRIPHVGWNEVHRKKDSLLMEGIKDGTDFYFVHSFHFEVKNPEYVVSSTPYCGGFISSVERENVFGTQFHPEKSQRPGFQLLRNFMAI